MRPFHYSDSARPGPSTRRRLRVGVGTLLAVLIAGTVPHASAVNVQIQSPYGASQVHPQVFESGEFNSGQQVIFSAPRHVYLDRYMRELAPTEANIRDRAYYRAENTGLTIDGGNVTLSGDNSFVTTLTNDITVVWLWELQHAVIVESATANIDGLEESLGNPAIGGLDAPIGKHWYAADTLIGASIDGIITPGNSTEQDSRFSTRGFTIENAPDQDDHYLEFNGKNTLMVVPSADAGPLQLPSVNLGDFNAFTIEFWARQENSEPGVEQDLVRFINDPDLVLLSFGVLRIGIRPPDDATNPNGLFIATNDAGGIVAEVPGAYVDDAWHHWAWTHDGTTDTLRCYRDGTLLLTAPDSGFLQFEQIGVGYKLHQSPGGPPFPTYPAFGFLTGANVIEAEAYTSKSDEWTPQSTSYPFSAASDGKFMTAPFVKSGYLEYDGLNIPAGTNRLVLRGISYNGGPFSIEVNGQDTGVQVQLASILEAFDNEDIREVSNVASAAFVVTEPIQTIRLNSPSAEGYLYFDEFQVQRAIPLDSVAVGLGLPQIENGITANFTLSGSGPPDNSAIAFSTSVRVDDAGVYEFRLTSEDGSILTVDGTEVVNNDGVHDASTPVTGSISLATGEHTLGVGYFKTTGGSSLSVEWNPPNDTPDAGFIPIPDDLLRVGDSIQSVELGNRLATDRPFAGGLNNVRFWNRALTVEELLANSEAGTLGTNVTGLELEFTFDDPDLHVQTSTEGNDYTAALSSVGPSDFSALLPFGGDKIVVPSTPNSTSMPDEYTLEARLLFPLPPFSGEQVSIISPANDNHHMHINSTRKLGMSDGGSFYSSGYTVTNLAGWHMLSCTKSGSQTRYYVDGGEVGTVNHVLTEPIRVLGNHWDTTNHAEEVGFLDEVRVWDGVRTPGQMQAFSAATLTGGESNLLAYWNFDDRTARDVSGNGKDGMLVEDAVVVSAPLVDSDPSLLSSAFPEFIYQSSDAIARIATGTYTLQDWIRITWLWEVSFRLQVAVNDPQFEDLPFIVAHAPGLETYEGTASEELWLPEFSEVTLGAYYRTTDRCYTLDSIQAATKLFNTLTPQTMEDGTRNGRATRQITYPAIKKPGSLHLTYNPTVYHALLPLGEGLDASSTAALNNSIVPDLCDGAQLKRSPDAVQVTDSNASRPGGVGAPDAYDEVYNTLYTVWPGVFEYRWEDANSNVDDHKLSVISGFPTNQVDGGWQIEDKDGYRLDTNGVRIVDSGLEPTTLVTFQAITDAFPGSPAAHYNYLYSVNSDQTIPVDLDADDSDRWHWQSQPFADASFVNDQTAEFTSNDKGQSVLVFSYRTNANEVATGDLTREALVVRVVDSIPLNGNTETGDSLSYQNHRELHLTSTNGQYLQPTADGSNYGLGRNTDRTWDLWVKLDREPTSTNSDRVLFEIDVAHEKLVQFGFRSMTNAVNPGGFYYSLEDSTQGVTEEAVEFSWLAIDDAWHHWGIVFDQEDRRFYMDGNLLTNLGSTFPYPLVTVSNYQSYGYSVQREGNWLDGTVDNWRIWLSGLTTEQIRTAMTAFTPDLGGVVPVSAVSFDLPPSGAIIPRDSGTAAGFPTIFKADGSDGNALSVLELQAEDGPAEVASRLDSKMDTAELGAGFVLNEVANYNPSLYNRNALVGEWGEVFPVNWHGIYTNDNRRLITAYYQNPSLAQGSKSLVLHPDVAWPYIAIDYDNVVYPTVGKDKDHRIYIASRLGSEGVDANGVDQLVFAPALYDPVIAYNQPDRNGTAGYNPNEEHALIAPSIKSQLVGDSRFNLGQSAAFALQNTLNSTNKGSASTFTSEPWVLVQYREAASGEWDMAAYKVEQTREGGGRTNLFPAVDPVTHLPTDPLGQPVPQPSDPMYDFDYISFAGEVLIPPYPLDLVVGSLILTNNHGGNIQVNGIDQRTLWNDKDLTPWMVSGNGRCFYRNWYPLRDDFWFDWNGDGANDVPTSTPIAWLPAGAGPTASDYLDGNPEPEPVPVRYSTYWGQDYPKLKRGESMTYVGGENVEDNPLDEGLPGIVDWASGQVIFDSRTPAMVFNTNSGADIENGYSARVIRPLDRFQAPLSQSTLNDAQLTPGSGNVQVESERWYFKGLTGSLQKRFYYDSLLNVVVYRGRLNDLEGGDPDVLDTPISLYALEPNVMTREDYVALLELPSSVMGLTDSEWTMSVTQIYTNSQNPAGVSGVTPTTSTNAQPVYWAGVQDPGPLETAPFSFYTETLNSNEPGSVITLTNGPGTGLYEHLDSLGTGAALVPNPSLLTNATDQALYVTLVENNNTNVNGAVALHIIEIAPARFRGGIKVVEAQNIFDEKINLRHTADFGGNPANAYYEWWIHPVAQLDTLGTPDEATDTNWVLLYKGLGLNQIEFSARPDIAISDQLFLVRYGEQSEFADVNNVLEADWRLVSLEFPNWAKTNDSRTPYQWAGAANSPQLQADGSRKYIPQLVMGWVKRVLDRINPYEARYSDFVDTESPATYSSMIQEAGKPFNGAVALNSDKDYIEGVGLIELYETVLERAKELTLGEQGGALEGTSQALLLAATRLATLYELLAREAYSDAQNPTILVTPENGLATAAPFVHAFYNQQATLLDEELALLRGTDFVVAYPAYNRLFWNYVKGLGEAAYNANYRIYDVTEDGFINEYDAATLYPQGHGDAWGHFLSANQMHYELLKNDAFTWEAKAELYGLLDNVIPTDYLDEKSFARIAAAKARTGKEIVAATYRAAYTQDPDGQWQGYQDPDTARAWGVSEWASRAGQAALFDWFTANAITPTLSPTNTLEGLNRIDRLVNQAELGELAGSYVAIQDTLDLANNGGNPLGLDNNALTFDIDPFYDGIAWERATHFAQVYDRATAAAANAIAALDYATQADQQLQRLADDTLSLQTEALSQDLSYRNRLIEIFGTPYEGTIGPGQLYEDGYNGPDPLLYMYMDRVDTDPLIPGVDPRFTGLDFDTLSGGGSASALGFHLNLALSYNDDIHDASQLFDDFYLTQSFTNVALGTGEPGEEILSIEAPVVETGDFAFLAPSDWGKRASPGEIQSILNQMLLTQLALNQSVEAYAAYVDRVLIKYERVTLELDRLAAKKYTGEDKALSDALLNVALTLIQAGGDSAQGGVDSAWRTGLAVAEFFPGVTGFSDDVTSAARGSVKTTLLAGTEELQVAATIAKVAHGTLKKVRDLVDGLAASDANSLETYAELQNLLEDLGQTLTEEEEHRAAIAQHVQQMIMHASQYRAKLSEGLRLLDERSAYNMVLAAKAQRNRYSDMMLRQTRNDALTKYQGAFDNALRYAWLAAKAYDYETSLDPNDAAAATYFLEQIVKTRQLGNWVDGQPRIGNGGLAEILAQLKANFDVLEGQLGINNPQNELGTVSLRYERFRIPLGTGTTDTKNWQAALLSSKVSDLWQIPEFRQYCRPFADPSDGPQPGIVIEFSTEITPGLNVFGKSLGAGDHAYSSANFATKIRAVGVQFQNYNNVGGISATPRVYLVPTGTDRIRISNAQTPAIRDWTVAEQRIPAPFLINQANLTDPGYIPSIDSLDGVFGDLRRFGDFRAYDSTETDPLASNTRLVGRSVWNTRWLLIIPGLSINADPDAGLNSFINGVQDILLRFQTYSNEGI